MLSLIVLLESILTKICIPPRKLWTKCSVDFVLVSYTAWIRSSSILQALYITCKAVTVHYPCTWLPTVEPTPWHKTKCSGACQQPDTKSTQAASTPELDHEEAHAMKLQIPLLASPCVSATPAKLQQCHSTAHCKHTLYGGVLDTRGPYVAPFNARTRQCGRDSQASQATPSSN